MRGLTFSQSAAANLSRPSTGSMLTDSRLDQLFVAGDETLSLDEILDLLRFEFDRMRPSAKVDLVLGDVGAYEIPDDFDAPLPDDLLDAFER